MNKLILCVISLLLVSCADRHKLQPSLYSKGEYLLSQGVNDYKNDHFLEAQQNFNKALTLYQSVDNIEGVGLARINLVKTLLALTKLDQAEKQLKRLKQKQWGDKGRSKIKYSMLLLEVKLLFKQQQYRPALQLLEPLLQQENSKKNTELLAIAARLEALILPKIKPYWLNEFREHLLKETKIPLKFHIILKRIEAILATQNKQYSQAVSLLQQTLAYYKEQVDRRAIATCLEQIAEIELKQNNLIQGRRYLNRALVIRQWLKDQYHIDMINQKLGALRQDNYWLQI